MNGFEGALCGKSEAHRTSASAWIGVAVKFVFVLAVEDAGAPACQTAWFRKLVSGIFSRLLVVDNAAGGSHVSIGEKQSNNPYRHDLD